MAPDFAAGEPNITCEGLGIDLQVRTPGLGPNDVIDVGARTYPLVGRVHDCAADGRVLGVVTGSQVVLVDITKDGMTVLDRRGADRVAMAPGVIRWKRGTEVTTRRR